MSYKTNNPSEFDMSRAYISSACISDNILSLEINGAVFNEGTEKFNISMLSLSMSDFAVKSAIECQRSFLSEDYKNIVTAKAHSLYKSEIGELLNRLTSADNDIDIIKFEPVVSGKNPSLILNVNFSENAQCKIIEIRLTYSHFTANWNEKLSPIAKRKQTIAERTAQINRLIPAVFLAMGHKDTPKTAKIICAIAVAYGLSPIDLIPDFIPVIGYLDDIFILSGLLYMAVKLIPEDVMAECRAKSDGMWQNGKPQKWYYAMPIIIFWLLIIMLVIGLAFKIIGKNKTK